VVVRVVSVSARIASTKRKGGRCGMEARTSGEAWPDMVVEDFWI
jgi:hypothetical protein